MTETWTPTTWKDFPILQQPTYTDSNELSQVLGSLSSLPPLVFAEEVRSLKASLAEVANGKAFILQGGDCAESFSEFSEEHIQSMIKVMLQMAVTLTFAGKCPVVKIGRMAGQFAKPRSADYEEQDGVSLPSFRGDNINQLEFTEDARLPDPNRLKMAYHQSAATLNLLRALTRGGFASLKNVRQWNSDAIDNNALSEQYGDLSSRIHDSLEFMESCGINVDDFSKLQGTAIYTSHEALLLDFEQAMLRKSDDGWYDLSAHMLWIGERTRQLDHAHVEFLRGVENPIGVKVGPTADVEEIAKLADLLDPENTPGKLIFITRVGADGAYEKLVTLFERMKQLDRKIIWICDPMHGNTVKASSGYKTRKFEDILSEVQAFFRAHKTAGTWPGGIHLEMTGRNVTECTGGAFNVSDEDLKNCYDTMCDPRLNASQSLELAFLIAEQLREKDKDIGNNSNEVRYSN